MSNIKTIDVSQKDLKRILTALNNAQDHLEYCGWGDSWERECAYAAGLPKEIDVAIDLVKELLK